MNKGSLNQTQTETHDDTESISSDSSASSSGVASRKSVTFQNIEIKQYNMVLGDHPSVSTGPAITIEWDPISRHVLSIDEYESAFEDGGKRRGQELRMPESMRKDLLAAFHSEEEMKLARLEVRRVQSQRNMSRAMEEFETLTSVLQSAGRKYKKWQNKRKGAQPEPAEAWLKQYAKSSKEAPSRSRAKSWTPDSAQNLETNPAAKKPLRHSASTIGISHA
eukprot:scaffold4484_cov170-Amphora_coffeaeformis.AAC.1